MRKNIPLAPFKGGIYGGTPSKGEFMEEHHQKGNLAPKKLYNVEIISIIIIVILSSVLAAST